MSKRKILLIGFIAVCIIRLIITQFMGLMPQDAYYYFYSEQMALSYFDHPPMVAYMLKIFTTILGKSAAAIKMTDLIVTGFSLLSFYWLCQFFVAKARAIDSTLLYGTTLMVTLISINTTPDVPMILFWTLSLIALYKAIFEENIYYWILSGVLIGMAFDSKYTALFLLFGVFIFLVLSEKHRRFLFSKELLLLLFFFVLTISPIFLWNVQNDWMSFKFQSSDRASTILEFRFRSKFFFGNIGTQLLLLLPVLFSTILFMFYKLAKKTFKKRQLPNAKILFLLSFSIPIIAFFFPLSLFYWVKLNWMMPGYIAAIVLVGHYIDRKWIPYHIIASILFHLVLLVQIVFYPIKINSDDTWFGWEELSEEVLDLKQDYPNHFVFSNDGYKTSATLSFYLEEEIYSGNVLEENGLQFSVIQPDLSALLGGNALFIDSDKRFKNLDQSNKIPKKLQLYFEEVIQLEPIVIYNNGEVVRKFHVFECKNYHSDLKHPDILNYVVDPEVEELNFYWKDANNQNYQNFEQLKLALDKEERELLFAVNGGMYKKDFSPKGLYIENGKMLVPLDTIQKGEGNFYLQPNGVFYLTEDELPGICISSQFSNKKDVKYATQSGPMLLIEGEIHPVFNEGSTNLNIRNGVGVLPNGQLLFAMSKEKINFYDFASYFKRNGCKNALYLDGFVSKTYLPSADWNQKGGEFGVIIGEVKKK